MSIYQRLINLDTVFKQLEKPPIIINDLQTSTEEEKAELNKRIYTLYDSGVMTTVARCECGKLTGDYSLGLTCHVCNTEVVSPLYQDLEPILWIRAPKGVSKLMNPHVWFLLNRAFSISNFSLIRWVCDPSYAPPRELKEVKVLNEMGIKRGYNHFVDNFRGVVEILSNLKTFSRGPKAENIAWIHRMINEYPDCIFSQYLPVPNRLLLVIEDTNMGRYADHVYFGVIDAIQMVASIDTVRTRGKKKKKPEPAGKVNASDILGGGDEPEFINLTEQGALASPDFLEDNTSVRRKEIRTVKMLHGLALFYNNYYKDNLGSKPGLVRKHIFSARVNFSCRAVITSITEPHVYDELIMPWTAAVGTLRFHILNKLTKRGFQANYAIEFINNYARLYHPLLDEIFTELIEEAVHTDPETGELLRGIPVTLCRNPSLGRGSVVRLRVTKIRKDPSIWSLGLSIMNVNTLNADFDGDAVGVILMLDGVMTDATTPLLPHKNIYDMSKPRALSSAATIPKPVAANFNHWYYQAQTPENNQKMQRFLV